VRTFINLGSPKLSHPAVFGINQRQGTLLICLVYERGGTTAHLFTLTTEICDGCGTGERAREEAGPPAAKIIRPKIEKRMTRHTHRGSLVRQGKQISLVALLSEWPAYGIPSDAAWRIPEKIPKEVRASALFASTGALCLFAAPGDVQQPSGLRMPLRMATCKAI